MMSRNRKALSVVLVLILCFLAVRLLNTNGADSVTTNDSIYFLSRQRPQTANLSSSGVDLVPINGSIFFPPRQHPKAANLSSNGVDLVATNGSVFFLSRQHPKAADVSENCGNKFRKPLKPVDPNYKKHVKYNFVYNDQCYPNAEKKLYWNVDKKVVVRSVFPEGRNWNGHTTSYVFMIEADRLMLTNGSFVKCQVGDQSTTDMDYFIPENVLQNDAWCHLTHLQAVVHCFLPLHSTNNSRSFLSYRMGPDSPIVVAESERPLWIPPPRVNSSSVEKITIASCIATQYGQPPFLGEWVRYQKTIGIDHIHMVAEPSVRESGALDDPSVKKAMEEGFLSVDIWFKWFSAAQIFDHAQLLAYQDCLYRFQGTYDYLFPHDADDFFVPLVSDHRKLPYYVANYCRGAGTCHMPWYQMCPTCGVSGPAAEDGNMTDVLVSFDRCKRKPTKSVHSIPVTFDISTHTGHRWLPGYGIKEFPSGVLYVAHLRLFP